MTIAAALCSRFLPSLTEGNPQAAQHTRRHFLLGALGMLVTAASVPVLTLTAIHSHADTMPDAADLEIAALGALLRETHPEDAARTDAWARKAIELAPDDHVDWQIAERARVRLTEHSRVVAELDREEILFVDGWLLTKSEAGAALLYAAAAAQSPPRSQTQVVE